MLGLGLERYARAYDESAAFSKSRYSGAKRVLQGATKPLSNAALGSDAKPSYTISVGETPLAVARKNGYSDDVVKLLEEHVDAKFPLHAAAKAGDIDTMTELLDGGAEVDGVANGRTALSIACENGQVDAAKLLLDRGADLGCLTRVASAPEDSASAPNVSPVSP